MIFCCLAGHWCRNAPVTHLAEEEVQGFQIPIVLAGEIMRQNDSKWWEHMGKHGETMILVWSFSTTWWPAHCSCKSFHWFSINKFEIGRILEMSRLSSNQNRTKRSQTIQTSQSFVRLCPRPLPSHCCSPLGVAFHDLTEAPTAPTARRNAPRGWGSGVASKDGRWAALPGSGRSLGLQLSLDWIDYWITEQLWIIMNN